MHRSIILAICTVILTTPAFAQAPDSVSYQGIVTDPSGTPQDTTVQIAFRLLKHGSLVWQETHAAVEVSDGVFGVLLGSVSALDTLAFDAPMELRVKIGTDPWISPNISLVSAPYALGMRGMYATFADDGEANVGYNIIGGSERNVIGTGVVGATISGGGGISAGAAQENSVLHDFATVGGGAGNSSSGVFATVAGGKSNTAGHYGAVGGGTNNSAGAGRSVVAGGESNTADGYGGVVGGGLENSVTGTFATVPGGERNTASGITSFAAGSRAKAIHNDTFVWNDAIDSLASTGHGQFLIKAYGGVGIGTNSPRSGSKLDVAGPIYAGGETLIFTRTSAAGSSGLDDGVRIRYDNNFYGTDKDYLVFEKTDANQNAPDGGVAFVNTGSDGVVETSMQIFGSGSVWIPGNLTKGSGSFMIDHPLDPENMYLFHSFVESPDMKNVYDGVAQLDQTGVSVVELPSYFEALNRDFRYQLTPLGGAAPDLHVLTEISGNRFEIAGGQPGMKVSWQVTGIRKDAYAEANRIEVEVNKPPEERGTYLHPR